MRAVRCPVTLGKYLVYRDDSHLTATMAEALAPYLGPKLAPPPPLTPTDLQEQL